MSGLKTEIQKDVIKARPKNLVEAFALSQLYEKDDMSTDLVRYCPPKNAASQEKGSTSTNAILPYQANSNMSPHKRQVALPPPMNSRPPTLRQKLSPTKMRAKREKNECFNCTEKLRRVICVKEGYSCYQLMGRVFLNSLILMKMKIILLMLRKRLEQSTHTLAIILSKDN